MASAVVDVDPIIDDIAPRLTGVVSELIKSGYDPEEVGYQLRSAFATVGQSVKAQTYGNVSKMLGASMTPNIAVTEAEGAAVGALAISLQRDFVLTRDNIKSIVESLVGLFVSDAKEYAFTDAKALQLHPTLRRKPMGKTCNWCMARAGTHTDPSSELFRRHAYCDCKIIVSGYNTRNGVVNNYVKIKPKAKE